MSVVSGCSPGLDRGHAPPRIPSQVEDQVDRDRPMSAALKAAFADRSIAGMRREWDYFWPSTSGTYARNPAKTSSLCSKNGFPLSRESIWAMSSSVSVKSNRSMF